MVTTTQTTDCVPKYENACRRPRSTPPVCRAFSFCASLHARPRHPRLLFEKHVLSFRRLLAFGLAYCRAVFFGSARAGVLLRLPAGVRVQAGGERGAAVRSVHVPCPG